MDKTFWQKMENLVFSSKIVIDRPKGSSHPKYPAFLYPVDYGYLEGTKANDGAEIDVWVGTLPSKTITAILCTVDSVKRDVEIKILIGCSLEEENQILKTMNTLMSAIVVHRKHS